MVIYGNSDRIKYHTILGDILMALHGYHIPLTWMLTDLDCSYFSDVLHLEEPIIITGVNLDSLIRSHPQIQVIWGVLSGFRLPPEEINLSILPKAEDSDVWEPGYQIQHPQAECELVAFDSSATFFRSRNQKAMRIFARKFPEALTLEAFNQNKK